MPQVRLSGVSLPEDEHPDLDFDVEFEVVVQGDDEAVVEKVAIAARDRGIRALQAFATGDHPDDCDGGPLSIDWEGVVAGEYDFDPDGPGGGE